MVVSILTLFPELYTPFINTSLLARAQQKNLVLFDIKSLFEFCVSKERVDSPTFGHGAGMLLRPPIVEKAIENQRTAHGPAYTIFFSPRGTILTQPKLRQLATVLENKKHVMLVASRYEGMDARVEEEYADELISIGNYVLMGGDLPVMVFLEGLLRLMPGVVGKQESVAQESFSGPFVEYPEYTTPVIWHDKEVPAVLRSGNHKEIQVWRENAAAQRTVYKHFDWLRAHKLTQREKNLAQKYIPSHYCVLMHDNICLPGGKVGTSSVTSIDIHDIARSARTYNLKEYFIVTPLVDQQKIVQKLLSFWQTPEGQEYNPNRSEAVACVNLKSSLEEVVHAIEQKEGKKPLLIATAARSFINARYITYYDQQLVWSQQRPVLFLFGTARGLSTELIEHCDYILEPLYGFSDFNHLSVRSAAGIIFDRWLGINPKFTV